MKINRTLGELNEIVKDMGHDLLIFGVLNNQKNSINLLRPF